MNKYCKNCKITSYTGTENTPKGLGYCCKCARLGTHRVGKDKNTYVCKKNKTGNKYWAKTHSQNIQSGGGSLLLERRLLEPMTTAALDEAVRLKNLLNHLKLNIVTAESLTAGMITKMLVDVPGEGATVYGGYVVYDTDAKRQMINVITKGVYSNETAKQMAEGALNNSRAMVALAVTGNAMPYPIDKNSLGIVSIGVALHTISGISVTAKTIKICENKYVEKLCNDWKNLNTNKSFSSYQMTSYIADYIRLNTVQEALKYAKEIIMKNINSRNLSLDHPKPIYYQNYDGICKPSWIIEHRMYNDLSKIPICVGTDNNTFDRDMIENNSCRKPERSILSSFYA